MTEVTRILQAVERGEPQATEELLPVVYRELRRLAGERLAQEPPGQTLQATALVHEAYLRLVDPNEQQSWDNQRHFFAAAAEAMRRILVERARSKRSEKHGGRLNRRDLSEADFVAPFDENHLLALDEALKDLATEDPQKAELVKLHYFSGLTWDQAGHVLGLSRATAVRYWSYARAWLYERIQKLENSG